MDTMEQHWKEVEDAVKSARLVAWDTCHKIYLAMDAGQERWFRQNYAPDIFTGTPDEMLAKLHEWWNESCGLRFISAVEGAGSEDDEEQEDEWKEWY